MLEAAFHGGKRYWLLLVGWLVLIAIGAVAYSRQLALGLTITGMSRDVSWGLYIAQFTFLVGVAASAVMVVLPYYLHNYKAFGKTVILGEFLAVSAVVMCMLFIFVDMGQPMRVLNVFLHPTLHSVMFWDSMVLFGYLILNLVIGTVTFDAERKGAPPPRWVRPLIYLSIPWAISIHTVTAFLYAGLVARPFWMTAIMAPRFLASAFASGPSLLILLALILRRTTRFNVGEEAVQKIAVIVTYAMTINLFFVVVELFTGLYGHMPEHVDTFRYLYMGLDGHHVLVPWMWANAILTLICVGALMFPGVRRRDGLLALVAAAVIVAVWIEKGMGLVIGGFIPSPLGKVTEYTPTAPEIAITVAVYALGFMVLTVLCRIVVNVREMLQAA
ncbi:MAG: polysulfide reductase NrfD [Gemmatimonadota bacterium]|jgi:Ni/Fe-hydrogenase subunit HybB-like protein